MWQSYKKITNLIQLFFANNGQPVSYRQYDLLYVGAGCYISIEVYYGLRLVIVTCGSIQYLAAPQGVVG